MKLRTTCILFLLCIVVTWGVEYLEGHKYARPFFDASQLLRVRIEAFRELTLERSGARIRLRKLDDGWWIEEPLRFRARQARVQSLLQSLREFRARGKADLDPAAYGVDRSTLGATLVDSRGTEYRWTFGDSHPDPRFRYVRFDSQMMLADSSLYDALRSPSLAVLRSDTLSGIGSAAAGSLAITERTPDGRETRIRFQRWSGGWRMEEPSVADASVGEVRALIDSIDNWVADEFVADGPGIDLARYGLDAPRFRVEIGEWNGARSVTLLAGGDGPPGADGSARVYVARSGEPHVFLAERRVMEALGIAPDSMRSRALVHLARPELASFDVTTPLGAAQLRPDPRGVWTMYTGGAEFPVDRRWLDGLVTDLREDSRIRAYLPLDRSNLERYGFDGREVTVVLTPDEGEAERLRIGTPLANEPGLHYVFNERWNHYAAALLGGAAALLEAPFSLRSLSVMEVAPDDMRRISVTDREGMTIGFARPRSIWRLAESPSWLAGREVDQQVLEPLAEALGELEAERWESTMAPESFELRVAYTPTAGTTATREFFVGAPLPEEGSPRLIRDGAAGWVFRWRPAAGRRHDPFALVTDYLERLKK